MNNTNHKNKHVYYGAGAAVASFVLLLLGVLVVLGNEVTGQNYFAYAIFSSAVGIITAVLYKFQFKIAGTFFLLGLVVGYIEMYRAFRSGMDGWGDLIGILSLFMWAIAGLLIGVVFQLGRYLYRKFKG